jgi:hypothetical protein
MKADRLYKLRKKRGPRIDPWGTPQLILAQSEEFVL